MVGSLVNSDLSLILSALEVSAAILANHAKDTLLKCSPKPAVAVLPHPLIFYQPLTIFECVRPLLLAFGRERDFSGRSEDLYSGWPAEEGFPMEKESRPEARTARKS